MKIEFGCGENPTKPGFKTCDIRDLPGVDFVCPAGEIHLHVEKNSVEEIWSRHFFEHLTFIQGEHLLKVWYDILKPDGKVEMMLPNMDYHIHQWITNSDMNHAKAGFWGWQREGDTKLWDVHKSGYNFNTLSSVLSKYNFRNIEKLSSEGKHLHVQCFK